MILGTSSGMPVSVAVGVVTVSEGAKPRVDGNKGSVRVLVPVGTTAVSSEEELVELSTGSTTGGDEVEEVDESMLTLAGVVDCTGVELAEPSAVLEVVEEPLGGLVEVER
jgi:hypothetical protein